MKGATCRVNTTPRKTKSTCLFLNSNNSFNMKLGGSASRGFPQGDAAQESHRKSQTIAANSRHERGITWLRLLQKRDGSNASSHPGFYQFSDT